MIWLILAPSKTNAQIQNLAPFAFGSIDNYFKAWDNLQSFDSSVIGQWVINSVLYSVCHRLHRGRSASSPGIVLAATQDPLQASSSSSSR